MSPLAASGQLLEHRALAAVVAPPPPDPDPDPDPGPGGGGGAGGFPADSFVRHIRRGSWLEVDTTALWAANGGDVAPGTPLLIDGVNAATLGMSNYTHPTAADPVRVVMAVVGLARTISLGSHVAVGDVHMRFFPWKARFESNPITNGAYFTEWPEADIVPSAANGYDATPFQGYAALHNGYSVVPQGDPEIEDDTSCMFCVLPGDQSGHQPNGTGIGDTRAELTYGEPFSNPMSGNGTMPGSPLALLGIDVVGALSRTARFWRGDHMIPSVWESPVPRLANSDGSFAMQDQGGNNGTGWWPRIRGRNVQVPIGQHSPTPTGQFLPFPPDEVGTIEYPIDDKVRNSLIDHTNDGSLTAPSRALSSGGLSNIMENYGPATLAWGSPPSDGKMRFRMNILSLGVFLPAQSVDSYTVEFDQRVCTILEYLPHMYATADGEPYIVGPGATNPFDGGALWQKNAIGSHPAGSLPVAPYGRPRTPDGELAANPGGGYVRMFRRIGGVWTCTSAGHPLAVPGNPTIVDGEVVDDPTYGEHAGKIFGPNVKCTAANLLTGPGGTSGVVIPAGTAAPFSITISTPIHGSLHTTGGWLSIDGELMLYDTYNTSTKTAHIVRRGVEKPAANHSKNALVAAMENWPTVNPGINAQIRLPVPLAVLHWPWMIGPTFGSVGGAPAVNYP